MQLVKQHSLLYYKQFFTIVLFYGVICSVSGIYNVVIKAPEAVLIGNNVNITAIVYDDGRLASSANYKYHWSDNAQHNKIIATNQPISNWTIQYPMNKTSLDVYRIRVNVERQYPPFFNIWINVGQQSTNLKVTNILGGELDYFQNGIKRKNDFVATKIPVNHTIILPNEDQEYLSRNATYVMTYWYQNCTYVGVSKGLSYEAVYNQTNQTYIIEAIVMASFKPIITTTSSTTTTTTAAPPTTSTTITPTTTASSTSTTTTPKPITTTTKKPNVITTSTIKSFTTATPMATTIITSNSTGTAGNIEMIKKTKRDASSPLIDSSNNNSVNQTTERQQAEQQSMDLIRNSFNLSAVTINPHLNPNFITAEQQELSTSTSYLMLTSPFNCATKEITHNDDDDAYLIQGYYKREIKPKDPISNFSVSGKTWLEHGDILNMEVKCKGSPSFEYCYLVYDAPYNSTGNETCPFFYSIKECKIDFTRYYSEIKKQSQLSVVVVPVTFTLIAIILIVFGVSYYVQSRNRFNVEVADFNFGETQSVDMEFKTFHQRLYESICNVLPRRWRFPLANHGMVPETESVGAVDSNIGYNTMN
uniref:Uncharacterized protein n=1 Tax=Glossina austeni TaxID=7395 RepID=A0A1A9VB86_GLOAU